MHIMHGIFFYSRMIYIKNKLYPCSDDVSETTISCIPKLVVPCSKLGQSRVYKVFFIAKIKLPCTFLNGGVSLKNQLIVSNIHCHYFLIILCDSMTRAYNAWNMYFCLLLFTRAYNARNMCFCLFLIENDVF